MSGSAYSMFMNDRGVGQLRHPLPQGAILLTSSSKRS
jgi:hypothetical protein